MSLQRALKKLAVVLTTGFVLTAGAVAAYADGCASCAEGGSCGPAGCCSQNGCCPGGQCPAPLIHCTPKVPKIKYKCVCGKPICDPCDLEGYGYFPTCWRPWTPPLSCGNSGVPCLTPASPLVPGLINQAQPMPIDVAPPIQRDETTLPLPQKMPK